ncbi:unnamed protein product [Diplocarpon coronariae]
MRFSFSSIVLLIAAMTSTVAAGGPKPCPYDMAIGCPGHCETLGKSNYDCYDNDCHCA